MLQQSVADDAPSSNGFVTVPDDTSRLCARIPIQPRQCDRHAHSDRFRGIPLGAAPCRQHAVASHFAEIWAFARLRPKKRERDRQRARGKQGAYERRALQTPAARTVAMCFRNGIYNSCQLCFFALPPRSPVRREFSRPKSWQPSSSLTRYKNRRF
jgi:hypothetical protein